MTAHAAMTSGVSAACDVLQTVITSRIKSVLPLQVSALCLHASASDYCSANTFWIRSFPATHTMCAFASSLRPGRHAAHALENVGVGEPSTGFVLQQQSSKMWGAICFVLHEGEGLSVQDSPPVLGRNKYREMFHVTARPTCCCSCE